MAARRPTLGTSIARRPAGAAEGGVEGACRRQLAGEDHDLGDVALAGLKIGLLAEELTEGRHRRAAAADPPQRQVGLEAAVLLAKAELAQGRFYGGVQRDHLLLSPPGAQPDRLGPRGVGKGPGAGTSKSSACTPATPCSSASQTRGISATATSSRNFNVKWRFCGSTHFTSAPAVSSPGSTRRPAPDGGVDFHGEKSAHGAFHDGHQSICSSG